MRLTREPTIPNVPREDAANDYTKIKDYRTGFLNSFKEVTANVFDDLSDHANDIANSANNLANMANGANSVYAYTVGCVSSSGAGGVGNNVVTPANYYFGDHLWAMYTDESPRRFILPWPGTIIGASISILHGNQTAANDSISAYIRKNNTTDYLIQTSITYTGSNFCHRFANTGMSVEANANDFFSVKLSFGTCTPADISVVTAMGTIYVKRA